MKKFVPFYYEMSPMYLQKENTLKPLALYRELGSDECIYLYNENIGKNPIPDTYQGIQFKRVGKKGSEMSFLFCVYKYIILNAKDIDGIFTEHLTRSIYILCILYKWLNPKGFIWVYADVEPKDCLRIVENVYPQNNHLKNKIRNWLYDKVVKSIDCYSVCTEECYRILKDTFIRKGWTCLLSQPQGVDEDILKDIPIRKPEEKENIILSVSRFGSYQKNTEMLLEGLSKTNLSNWKVILIGPISKDFGDTVSDEFLEYLNDFYCKRPDLKDKIIFTGPIYDNTILNNWFSRAKIFVMTSRHEGCANVYAQARWFGCHIVSTNVGGSVEASNNWMYGHMVKQEDPDNLANILNELLTEESKIKYPPTDFCRGASYKILIKDVIKYRR